MILIYSTIGFIVSAYALWVEEHLKHKGYRPVCNISKNISCSKAFSSHWGNLTGLPNSFFGLICYGAMILLTIFGAAYYVFGLSVLALLGTFYLAYISYFVQRNFCLVCTAIYVINIAIFLSHFRF